MPYMNGSGPDNKGKESGRGLGYCSHVSHDEALAKLGTGMGMRRKNGGGKGRGKRLQAGLDKVL
jgi:hypothetical protein